MKKILVMILNSDNIILLILIIDLRDNSKKKIVNIYKIKSLLLYVITWVEILNMYMKNQELLKKITNS